MTPTQLDQLRQLYERVRETDSAVDLINLADFCNVRHEQIFDFEKLARNIIIATPSQSISAAEAAELLGISVDAVYSARGYRRQKEREKRINSPTPNPPEAE